MKNINIAFEIRPIQEKGNNTMNLLVESVQENSDRPDQNREGNSTSNQNNWQVHTISDDLNSQTGSYHNEVDVNFESRINAEHEVTSLGKDNTLLESRYRIIVEPSLCLAFGSCETLTPKVFVVKKDRRINPKAIVISETLKILKLY